MTSMTPALQKQDERKQELSEPSDFNNNWEDTSEFSVYRSPFESFPRLRDYPRPVLISEPVSSLSSPSASHMYPSTRSSLSSDSSPGYAERSSPLHSLPPFSPTVLLPDLKPLKLAFQVKFLDPFKPLCRYEIPGDGTCLDDACDDIHLKKLEGADQMGLVEPTGTWWLASKSWMAHAVAIIAFFLLFFFWLLAFCSSFPTTTRRLFIFFEPVMSPCFPYLSFPFPFFFLCRSRHSRVSLQGHARPMAGGTPYRFAIQDIFEPSTLAPTDCGQLTAL
jgi:hypothetical protein